MMRSSFSITNQPNCLIFTMCQLPWLFLYHFFIEIRHTFKIPYSAAELRNEVEFVSGMSSPQIASQLLGINVI